MGLGSFFGRRRRRESAIPPDVLEELAGSAEIDAASGQATPVTPAVGPGGPASAASLPGTDGSDLGAMLRRAALTGMPQVSSETHTVDMRGNELGGEVSAILSAFGIGAAAGPRELGEEELAALRERLFAELRRQGADGAGPG